MTAQPIAVCRSYAELQRAIREHCQRQGITRQRLDQRTGLADGHSAKLLGPAATKSLGRVSLGLILDALDLALVVQIRPDTPACTNPPTGAHENASDEKPARQDWRRNRGTAWGKRMAARRALRMTAEQRTASARHAAQARWQRTRQQAGLRPPNVVG